MHLRDSRCFDYKGFHPNIAGRVRNKDDVITYCVKEMFHEGKPNFITNLSIKEIFKAPKLKTVKEYSEMSRADLANLNP